MPLSAHSDGHIKGAAGSYRTHILQRFVLVKQYHILARGENIMHCEPCLRLIGANTLWPITRECRGLPARVNIGTK